ncbi:MAG TPA: D-alanine--D-alanine ligase [Acetobacteraceae bacterium]|nr:D-alanine--D-alanine ligase [Acetobacteraceae bacterium]
MRIGLTYDLAEDWAAEGLDAEGLAEFDTPETIDAVADFLHQNGHRAVRIGRAQALVPLLAEGERWDLVFNICEGVRGAGREALVPAVLDAYAIPYVFSDPLVLAIALHKGHLKRLLRDAGLPTAPFAVLDSPPDQVGLPFPLFVKPIAEGTGKGIDATSLCRDKCELACAVARLTARFGQQVLVETYLPGREFTVGVLGSGAHARIIGVMEIISDATYGFDTKKHYRDHVSYRLVKDEEAIIAGNVALAAWRLLGGRDGGRIDLKSDTEGQPMLLEINPLAGLHPIDSDLVILARLAGHSYEWLLEQIFAAACGRFGLAWHERRERFAAD